MKTILSILILLAYSNTVFSQKFINGNFEIHNANFDQINLSNEALNSMLSSVTAFGSYGDVDIIKSSNYGGSGAQNGTWYIALTGGKTDIVAIELDRNLIKGKKYSISFYDRKTNGYQATSVQIGLSETNQTIGDIIYTCLEAPILNTWTKRVFTFTAPNNGRFITVQMPEGSISDWVNIDNFNFENIKQNNTCDSIIQIETSTTNILKGNEVILNAFGSENYKWINNINSEVLIGSQIRFQANTDVTYTVISNQANCPTLKSSITIHVSEPILKDTIINLIDTTLLPKKVKFTKSRLNGRKYKIQEHLLVDNHEIKIQVYDKNRVDGDIVAIYLNGELIGDNIQVSNNKKELIIRLNPGKNILVMYALNLGKIPPNTAALAIYDGKKRARITTLVSDFKKSGAIEIINDESTISMHH